MFSQPPLRLALLPAVTFILAVAADPARAIDLGVQAGGAGVSVDVGGGSAQVGVGLGSGVDLKVDGDGLHVDAGGSGNGGAASGRDTEPQRLEQQGALDAVRSKRALPLEDILQRARVVVDGEIIDAQLISLQSILLYQLKVLGKGGDVSQLYFYARSGLPVRSD